MKLQTLVDQVAQTLDRYGVPYRDAALRGILTTWQRAKQPLYDLLSQHPQWSEPDLAVVFDYDTIREVDLGKITEPLQNICAGSDIRNNLRRYIGGSQVDNSLSCYLHTCYGLKAPVGQKTSRALNRLFKLHGLDEKENYNRDFSVLADALNPLCLVRHTLLSLHPCDYLTMSIGNSWRSCHHIGNGEYRAGCLSYLLDPVSMIFYTVDRGYDSNAHRFWSQPKITRQVYAYGNGVLLQSRLYPDESDSQNIDRYRHAVQSILAAAAGLPNLWQRKSAQEDIDAYVYTYPGSCHYRDYESAADYRCSVSLLRDTTQQSIEIGADAPCLICGVREVENDASLACDDCFGCCDECDNYYDRDDMVYVEATDRYVCPDCLKRYYTQCENCEEYYPDCDMTETADGYACPDCLERYYTQCNHCEEYYPDCDLTETADGCVCRDCLERYYTQCESCNEYCSIDNVTETADGPVCPDCLERFYTRCEGCGAYITEDEERKLCESCHEAMETVKEAV